MWHVRRLLVATDICFRGLEYRILLFHVTEFLEIIRFLSLELKKKKGKEKKLTIK